MRKFLAYTFVLITITATLFICTMGAGAANLSGKSGENITWELDKQAGVLTFSGSGEMTNFEISGEGFDFFVYKIEIGDGITSISDGAFSGFEYLTEITLPNTITHIGSDAFHYCRSLSRVSFSSNLKSIGDNAFRHCDSLDNVQLPDDVESLGTGVFWGCDALKNVKLPVGIKQIPDEFFSNCHNLSKINIPDSVEHIGNSAFIGCSKLSDVKFPKNLKTIGDHAFNSCRLLNEITFPENLVSLGDGAFKNCSGIKELVLPESTTEIKANCFYDCRNLKKLSVTSRLATIGDYAFYNCGLILVNFNGTKIGKNAFKSCYDISVVTLENITSVGQNAFIDCYDIAVVCYCGSEDSWNTVVVESGNNRFTSASFKFNHVKGYPVDSGSCGETATWSLYDNGNMVIDGLGEAGSSTPSSEEWEDYENAIFSLTVNSGITSLSTDFSWCENLSNITLHDNMIHIDSVFEQTAFFKNSDNWQDGFLYIGKYLICADKNKDDNWLIKDDTVLIAGDAFFECSYLKEIAIPDSVKYICDRAFSNCYSLEKVVLSKSLLKIGNSAFAKCNKLKDVQMPESVEFIGGGAFENCYELSQIKLPVVLKTIGERAFTQTALQEIVIPDSVETIGEFAFGTCSKLQTVNIGNGLMEISYRTFYNCPELTKVTLGNKVSRISGEAFAHCKKLTEINLPESLTYIGNSAFLNCEKLKSVSLFKNVEQVENDAFINCYELTDITVDSENPYYCSDNGALLTADKKVFVCCPPGKTGRYVISDEVEEIGVNAFRQSILSEIVIGKNITRLNSYAFYGCSNIEEIVIPEKVNYISQSAFAACDCLENINVVQENSDYSSYGGVLLNKDKTSLLLVPAGKSGEYTVPDFIERVEAGAFQENHKVERIIIGDNVTYIGNSAFYNCKNLKSVVLPNSITEIRPYSFQGCTLLEGVVIPPNVTTIGTYAFYDCTNLKYVLLAKHLYSIKSYAFYRCNSLRDIYFTGSREEWSISISSGNDSFKNATVHYNYNQTPSTMEVSVAVVEDSICVTYCVPVIPADSDDMVFITYISEDGVQTTEKRSINMASEEKIYVSDEDCNKLKIFVWDTATLKPLVTVTDLDLKDN